MPLIAIAKFTEANGIEVHRLAAIEKGWMEMTVYAN